MAADEVPTERNKKHKARDKAVKTLRSMCTVCGHLCTLKGSKGRGCMHEWPVHQSAFRAFGAWQLATPVVAVPLATPGTSLSSSTDDFSFNLLGEC